MTEKNVPRRRFLAWTTMATMGGLMTAETMQGQQLPKETIPSMMSQDTTPKPKSPLKREPLPPDLVKEWVTKAHSDFEYIKTAFDKEPRLLNASWDWGAGDFETALEAAGHVGNRDIALFLIEKGARINIFCAAMLGQLEIVKTLLTAFPHLKESKGPHGLQLLHHAKKGGEQAKIVYDFLVSIEAK